jgi:hypothetical protein
MHGLSLTLPEILGESRVTELGWETHCQAAMWFYEIAHAVPIRLHFPQNCQECCKVREVKDTLRRGVVRFDTGMPELQV